MKQSRLRRVLQRLVQELAAAPALPDGPTCDVTDAQMAELVLRLSRVRSLLLRYRESLAGLQRRFLSVVEMENAAALARPLQGVEADHPGRPGRELLADERWVRLSHDRSPLAVHLLLAVGLGFTGLPEREAVVELHELLDGMLVRYDEQVEAGTLVRELGIPAKRLERVLLAAFSSDWTSAMPSVLQKLIDGPKSQQVIGALTGYKPRHIKRLFAAMKLLGLVEASHGKSPIYWRLTLHGRDVVAVWRHKRALM